MTNNAAVVTAAGGALLAIVVLIGAGTARPVQSVSYSTDGRLWLQSLAEPLLDKDIRWVPGDSRTSEFHIHNGTDRDGRLQVIVNSDNSAFVRALSVSIAGGSFGACAPVEVPAGEKKRIDATVTMSDVAGNDTRNSSAEVDLVLQWSDNTSSVCPEFAGRELEQEGAQP
ncbi:MULTISPECIES: hypothetical protein [Nocardiaceae]|uniref:hypothetical protein n=1 Tax=Nocardiaceae TaxID=85025 RepID=UPI00050C4029|nr:MULTISPECIES: hypothetical protein [Rhodococcus]OZC47096.1 hypothetical protein CH286_12895 [Rhodococcus sp. WWJCD1]OZE80452.1 hypothetical protein CH305_12890 [Rhodococcus sp. 15-649-2-2]